MCIPGRDISCTEEAKNLLVNIFTTPTPLSEADRILTVRPKGYTILNLSRPKKHTLAL